MDVDKLINDVLEKPQESETIKVTFKGEATTDPFEIALLDAGWQGGYEYAMENWTEGGCMPPFPEHVYKEHGFYMNGWAEGVKYAINRHLDRLYPGAISLSYNQKTRKYDAKY